jgi:multiple antibiotic resistance protein
MLKDVILSFIPIFVAVDGVGVLPIFTSLTAEVEQREKTRIITQSILTALALSIGFVLVGKLIFKWLGITMGDFMIAGGAILFCLAIVDLVGPAKRRRIPGQELGAVPLGTPLIAGPAVLTTSLVMVSQFGLCATIISLAGNILLAGLIFRFSTALMRFLGEAGTKALSKITSLLLAAIAVMLMRKGLEQFI